MTSATAFFARVSDANGEIAKLCLQRRHVEPGDTITGQVDFRETPQAARTCCQFSMSLIAVETFSPAQVDKSIPDERTVVAGAHETCIGTDAVSYSITVPENAIPTFSTGACKVNLFVKVF